MVEHKLSPEPAVGIMEILAPLGELKLERPVPLRRTYFDTFDWRLHRAGCVLAVEQAAPGKTEACRRGLADNRLLGHAATPLAAPMPRFVREFPPGPLRRDLEPIVEMRALLPVARARLSVQRAALLDAQGKTVLRLAVEHGWAGTGDGRCDRVLPARVLLDPVKGYGKALRRAQALLEAELKLPPTGQLLGDVLAAIGREAEDYAVRPTAELHPGLPAGEAVRRILLILLEMMQRNIEGVRAATDTEFLHDFRIAVRRTRSLFGLLKSVFPPPVLDRFRPDFKWLGEITGPMRDLDVYLLKLPEYRELLPGEMRDDLQPLQAYLERRREAVQRELVRQLRSARLRKLSEDWRGFLATEFNPADWPAEASLPADEVARRRTWKAYRRLIRDGRAITPGSPATALHRLRIDCKKFRYLVEFFQPLYPPGQLRGTIRALKALQDNLGDFQDFEVQADALKRFAREMETQKAGLPAATFMAMGVLIDSLYKRQVGARKDFAALFKRFARPKNQARCRALFHPGGRKAAAT
ncbi:MAG: CHAD domain-containing protein [Gammaproteobacteria bacterium]